MLRCELGVETNSLTMVSLISMECTENCREYNKCECCLLLTVLLCFVDSGHCPGTIVLESIGGVFCESHYKCHMTHSYSRVNFQWS